MNLREAAPMMMVATILISYKIWKVSFPKGIADQVRKFKFKTSTVGQGLQPKEIQSVREKERV